MAAIIIAAAAPAAIRNSKYAFHCAHRTTDASADCTADNSAHRTRGSPTLTVAVLRAANDALRVRGVRDGE